MTRGGHLFLLILLLLFLHRHSFRATRRRRSATSFFQEARPAADGRRRLLPLGRAGLARGHDALRERPRRGQQGQRRRRRRAGQLIVAPPTAVGGVDNEERLAALGDERLLAEVVLDTAVDVQGLLQQ